MSSTSSQDATSLRPLLVGQSNSAIIEFCRPCWSGEEIAAITEAMKAPGTDGNFTKKCHQFLGDMIGKTVLITQSCTAALEMAAILANIGAGDEVIMPSYTFVSTANAFVLRGAKIVFVDCHAVSCNIDENKVEAAITPKTKAIVCVHYAGMMCEMDVLVDIANRHGLLLIEDAAQAIGSTYKGKPAGSFGDLSTYSFHYTKNVSSGEGGALCVGKKDLESRAWVIWEKGTNRHDFINGVVDKYAWIDVGSSFLPSEITASILYTQLKVYKQINAQRMKIWSQYLELLRPLESVGKILLPRTLPEREHNAHIFQIFVLEGKRDAVIHMGKSRGIQIFAHYVPLHSSPAGLQFGRCSGEMSNTNTAASQLIRLPLHPSLTGEDIVAIANTVKDAVK